MDLLSCASHSVHSNFPLVLKLIWTNKSINNISELFHFVLIKN